MGHQTLQSKGIKFNNLSELLLYRSQQTPHKMAYTFLSGKDSDKQEMTYAELAQRVALLAQQLNKASPEKALSENERVMIICQPGLSYIIGFFSCLYAGMVAVPVYPPRNKKHLPRLSMIIKDAEASIALTTSNLLSKNNGFESLGISSIIAIDSLSQDLASSYKATASSTDDIAFLQYTSGSTGDPKGVMLTHGNLLQNLETISRCYRTSSESVGVNWLPPYHDMGLIGAILQPLYAGFPSILMAPETFLQKPLRWLQAMSDYKGTISAAPNFSYQLCIDKLSDKDCEGLDLSRWEIAVNGAEPIKYDTLKAFDKRFSKFGFKKSAFRPSYGLAESTLYVSGENVSNGFSNIILNRLALSKDCLQEASAHTKNETIRLVSAGRISREQRILICDPESSIRCANDKIGEIWLSGPSIGQGYWRKPKDTEAFFCAYEKNTGAGPFFRTGDLGFIKQGQLFITGRLKDLIIISGRNYYPQDIEDLISSQLVALRQGCCVAFGQEEGGKEQLTIVAEVERQYRKSNLDSLCKEVSSLIAAEHGLTTYRIALISPASIPKTSSGKVQRRLSAKMLQQNTLNILKDWTNTPATSVSLSHKVVANEVTDSEASKAKADSIKQWLRDYAEKRINSRLIDERRCIPPHIVLDFGEQGIMGMQIAAKYGGLNLTTRDALRVVEQLCAVDSTLAFFVGLNNTLGIRPIQYFANEETRDNLLPKLAKGRILASFALTEESAGSNPRSIQSTARQTSTGDWLINGTKIWSGTSAWAGVITVIAKNTDSSGMTAFAAQQGIAGMCMGEEDLTMGVRGMVQNSIHFENAEIPSSAVLGEVGAGMQVAQNTMTFARLGFGALGTGGMKHCAQLMLRYGERRTISTGKLLDNPLYRYRLGRINMRITALETFVYQIADCIDVNIAVPEEIYIVSKIMGSEFFYQSTDELMQALAGRGYIETNHIPQLLRDARLTRIFEGPTETLQAYLGARLLNSPESLQQFMQTQFNSSDQYDKLLNLAAEMNDRLPSLSSSFGGRHLAVQWLNNALGEIVPWLVLLASMQGQATKERSPQYWHTLAWLNENYDDLADKLRRYKVGDTYQSSDQLISDIEEYAADIGSIEKYATGERQQLNEMLASAAVTSNEVSQHVESQPEMTKETLTKGSCEETESVRNWLIDWVAASTDMQRDKIDVDTPFAAMGIDSIQATELSLEFTEQYDIEIDPTVAWEYPEIEQLAGYLAQLIQQNKSI